MRKLANDCIATTFGEVDISDNQLLLEYVV